jgi:hypothetical protein
VTNDGDGYAGWVADIGLGPDQALPAIKAMGTCKRIAFREVLGPIVLDVADGMAVVMPVRLD